MAPALATVLGGGSFGTSLALVLAGKGYSVNVWVRSAEQAMAVNTSRENFKYLPGVKIPDTIQWTSDVVSAVQGSDIVLFAIPTQFLRSFAQSNRSTLPVGVPLVLCAKGIELSTLQLPYDIIRDELPGKYSKYICVLSGPSFAKEIAAGHPTSVVVASIESSIADQVQKQMTCPAMNFRVYTVSDVMGAEIAGAVKNVLAIAAGAVSGLGYGSNTRAALICRGLVEMTRLADKMGSDSSCLRGLAGMGDLLLTCSSELSRNFTVGRRLAQGETLEEILSSSTSVAEGVTTTKALRELSQKLEVEMPLCEEVYKVLYEKKDVRCVLADLQSRAPGSEY
jgi:NAD-dependent glycerol-3-phosphate dehydrogenase